jgi:hypothetical protein
MAADEVRAAAARVQSVGDDVRRLADRTLDAGGVDWRSTAAGGFRQRLAEESARVRSAAGGLDRAAEALRRHAAAVDAVWSVLGRGGHR